MVLLSIPNYPIVPEKRFKRRRAAVLNLCFFSIIFMYFQLLPIDIETQPLLIVLCIPLNLLFCGGLRRTQKYNNLWFFLLLVVAYFYLALFFSGAHTAVTYLLKLTIGPLCFLFVFKDINLLWAKTVKLMTVILLLVSLILLMRPPYLYSALNGFFSFWFNRYTSSGGSRGFCILTTEPSYFVYFAFLILYSADYLVSKHRMKKGDRFFILLAVTFMSLLTKSAIVYLFLIFYLSFRVFRWFYKRNEQVFFFVLLCLGFLAAITIVATGVLNFLPKTNRLSEIISRINLSSGILDILFYTDSSAGFRFMINGIYLASVLFYPLGAGFGGLKNSLPILAERLGIDYSKNEIFIASILNGSTLDAQAFFANVIGIFGLLSIVFFVFFYSDLKLPDKPLKYSMLFTASVFLFFIQSNFVNPVFWVLLAMLKDDGFRRIVIPWPQENCKVKLSIR